MRARAFSFRPLSAIPAAPCFGKALVRDANQDQGLLPAIGLFSSAEGSRVVELRAKQLGREAERIKQRPPAQKPEKGFRPQGAKVIYERPLFGAAIAYIYLHAFGIADPSMQQRNAPQHP